MTIVQDQASLHETAVQKIARGEHEVPRARRTRGKAKNSRVTHRALSHLHPLVREYLKDKGLDADMRRLQITGHDDVIVWNDGAPRPKGVR